MKGAKMSTVLIIEDDMDLQEGLAYSLEAEGYSIIAASTMEEGEGQFRKNACDLILLDCNLPDGSGFEFCERIRRLAQTPVLMLTARDSELDEVKALNLGADDYLTKPFGTSELMARIRTALRHSQTGASAKSQPLYHVGDLMIDFERRLVKVKDQDVHLTQIEYKLVSLLAQNAGRVLTYDYIINEIWGPYADSNNQILRVNMAHIRRKLEANPAEPQYIYTEIGVGYRMREE